MPLRILHVVQRYPPALGGSESYFQRLSQYLAARGHEVTVWTTNALDLESFWSRRGRTLPACNELDGDVRVHRFACVRWPLRRYMLKALSFLPGGATWKCLTMPCNPIALGMWRATRDANYDIIHASAFPYAWPIVCARRAARRDNGRFFLTPFLHLGRPDAIDRTRRAYLAPPLVSLLSEADGIFVQTPSEYAAVVELGIPADRVVLQGMGVAPSECTGGNRAATRQLWGFDDDTVVVGHLANLSFEKGTIDLLQAAELAWAGGANFRVVLAGADMPNFRRFWDRFPAKSSVTILGRLDDSQKRDFFSAIDVFALPSRSDSFGLVLLEAWANCVPNLAYRCGGVADVIRHEHDGLLVPCEESATPRQFARLAEALIRLVGDQPLRAALGQAGQQRAMIEFRWEQKLAIVESTYQAKSPSPVV